MVSTGCGVYVWILILVKNRRVLSGKRSGFPDWLFLVLAYIFLFGLQQRTVDFKFMGDDNKRNHYSAL